MTLQQKILAALAGSTSRTPMSTVKVAQAVGIVHIDPELEVLRDAGKVGHCKSIKGGTVIDYWWLAGNVESKLLPQTAAANRKTKATARKENAKRIAGMAWWNK